MAETKREAQVAFDQFLENSHLQLQCHRVKLRRGVDRALPYSADFELDQNHRGAMIWA
jgi:hypothetical protein